MGELAYSLKLEFIDCPSCAAPYAINKDYVDRRRKDGKAWHCPYCQGITSFHGDDENSKLRKELEAEKARKLAALDEANRLRATNDQLRAAESRLKKTVERVKKGVCPCCTRSFSNLRDHIKTKHPDYVAEKAKVPATPKKKSSYAEQRLAEIKGGAK